MTANEDLQKEMMKALSDLNERGIKKTDYVSKAETVDEFCKLWIEEAEALRNTTFVPFDTIIRDPTLVPFLTEFVHDPFYDHDFVGIDEISLFFLKDVESLKNFSGQPSAFREEAKKVYIKYLSTDSSFRLNVDEITNNPLKAKAIKEDIEMWINTPNNTEIYFGIYDNFQQQVFSFLKGRHYENFLKSKSYDTMISKFQECHIIELKEALKNRRWIVALFASLLEKNPDGLGNLLLYMNIRRRSKETTLFGHASNVFHQHLAYGAPLEANGITNKVRGRALFDLTDADASLKKVTDRGDENEVADIDEDEYNLIFQNSVKDVVAWMKKVYPELQTAKSFGVICIEMFTNTSEPAIRKKNIENAITNSLSANPTILNHEAVFNAFYLGNNTILEGHEDKQKPWLLHYCTILSSEDSMFVKKNTNLPAGIIDSQGFVQGVKEEIDFISNITDWYTVKEEKEEDKNFFTDIGKEVQAHCLCRGVAIEVPLMDVTSVTKGTNSSQRPLTIGKEASQRAVPVDKKFPKTTIHAITFKSNSKEYYGMCLTEYLSQTVNKSKAMKEKRYRIKQANAANVSVKSVEPIGVEKDDNHTVEVAPTSLLGRFGLKNSSFGKVDKKLAVAGGALLGMGKSLFNRKDVSNDSSTISEMEIDAPKSADFSTFTSGVSREENEIDGLGDIVENEKEDEYLTIYVPKCYCVIGKICNFSALRLALIKLHAASKNGDYTKQQSDAIIDGILRNEDLPIEDGEESRIMNIPNFRGLYDLPVPKFSLLILFKCLSVDNIITLYAAAILERRIMLRSTQRNVLTAVAYAIQTLMYPLTWSHAFDALIPLTQLDAFTKLVEGKPFIGGTDLGFVSSSSGYRHLRFHSNPHDSNNVAFDPKLDALSLNTLIVDIDTDAIYIPKKVELVDLPNQTGLAELKKKLRNVIAPFLNFSSSLLRPDTESENQSLTIQESFAIFSASLFPNILSCFNIDISRNVLVLNQKAFLQQCSPQDLPFFQEFITKSCFHNFLKVQSSKLIKLPSLNKSTLKE